MTNFTFSMAPTSLTGSLWTAMMSAVLPGSIEPICEDNPGTKGLGLRRWAGRGALGSGSWELVIGCEAAPALGGSAKKRVHVKRAGHRVHHFQLRMLGDEMV